MGDNPVQINLNFPREMFRNPRKYWLGWLLVSLLIIGGFSWFTWAEGFKRGFSRGFNEGNEQAGFECSKQIDKICGIKTVPEVSNQDQEVCFTESFLENEKKWETDFYKKQKDSFWCPMAKFKDPVIWYRDGLRANFDRLTIEYEIKKDERSKEVNPPSFVFAYGRETQIFKLWVPEGENLQLFRFSKNMNFDLEESALEPDPAEELSDPVKIGTTNNLEIEPSRAEGNDLFLNFIFSYTSSLPPQKGEKDTIPKQVKMPISNIPTSSEKYPFGIGTYIGNCIRPVSYTICQ